MLITINPAPQQFFLCGNKSKHTNCDIVHKLAWTKCSCFKTSAIEMAGFDDFSIQCLKKQFRILDNISMIYHNKNKKLHEEIKCR